MAQVSIDGPNKQFRVLAGVTEINVESDLYSEWKRWLAESDNAKYLQAFRTFGGDPTSAGQFAPKYFFLLNGWKVEVDGDISPNVDVALNLYVDGGGNPFILSNNAVVSNLRSDVAVVESELQDTLDYNEKIIYDAIDGQSGIVHPTGTAAYPVNNSADLQTLMTLFDINKVLLKSNIIVTQDFNDVHFYSETADEFLNPSGFKTQNCFLNRIKLFGDFGGSNLIAKDCFFSTNGDVSGIYGLADNCHLCGKITIQDGEDFTMSQCSSNIPGSDSPTIDFGSGTLSGCGFSLRTYSGGIRLINMDHPDDISTLEFVAGKAHIGPVGCTDGYVSVRGIAELDDSSNGTTVDTSALFETSNEYNGVLNYGEEVGAKSGIEYPIGTSKIPVNNWADAVVLMDKYNLHNINLHTNTVLTEPLPNKHIASVAGIVAVDVNNQDVNLSKFVEILIYGDFNHSQVVMLSCFVGTYGNGVQNFQGVMKDCAIEGDIQLSTAGETSIIDCVGGDAAEIITIDKLSGQSTTLNVRRYSGGFNIINSDQVGEKSAIVLDSGKVWLDSSCTNGVIAVAGSGELIDNSNGSMVNIDGLLDPYKLNVTMNEILGLSQSNFVMTDQTYTVSGSLETATIKTYPSATDVTNGTNEIAIYNVNATYDGNGLLTNYMVKKQ